MRTTLRAHVASIRPVELVLSSDVSQLTSKVITTNLRNPRINKLAAGREFWDAAETKRQLDEGGYFTG